MESFRDDPSKKDQPTLEVCSTEASQAEDQQEAKYIEKKSEDSNKLSFDTGPWWRLADREELTSLVAQRSVNLIENCDLPHPQNSRFRGGDPYGNFARADNFPPSLHLNPCAVSNNSRGSCIASLLEAQVTESDPTKADLLEALCRCQTRAREAERLASQTYTEKEDILKLFFQQASHLFAYKQWFQLLQLENLHFQNKVNDNSGDDNDQPSSILFAVNTPSVDRKTGKLRKMKKNPSRRKRSRKQSTGDHISKFGVAFAIGFGLIGAGLLLGWTVGSILPLF